MLYGCKVKVETKLNLVLHDKHFSLIVRLDTFAKAFDCERCEASFSKLGNLRWRKCITLINLKFPNKCYASSPTIFLELEN